MIIFQHNQHSLTSLAHLLSPLPPTSSSDSHTIPSSLFFLNSTEANWLKEGEGRRVCWCYLHAIGYRLRLNYKYILYLFG